ncbi:MAG: SufE family protein [Holophagales bacterium]|nr:SufE family protein [Holophagales bacterium]
MRPDSSTRAPGSSATDTYPESLAELVETLGLLDRQERIQVLIDISDRFRDVPAEVATRPFADDHKVPACESEAYVWTERLDDGTPKLYFAVENPQGLSAKAMAVILDEHLSGVDPERVARVSPDLVYEIFGRELSMGKSMGLMGMVSMVTHSARKLAVPRAGGGAGA